MKEADSPIKEAPLMNPEDILNDESYQSDTANLEERDIGELEVLLN